MAAKIKCVLSRAWIFAQIVHHWFSKGLLKVHIVHAWFLKIITGRVEKIRFFSAITREAHTYENASCQTLPDACLPPKEHSKMECHKKIPTLKFWCSNCQFLSSKKFQLQHWDEERSSSFVPLVSVSTAFLPTLFRLMMKIWVCTLRFEVIFSSTLFSRHCVWEPNIICFSNWGVGICMQQEQLRPLIMPC